MSDTKPTAVDLDSARFSRALRSSILWPVCVILLTAVIMLMTIAALMRVVKWSEHSYSVVAVTRDCEGAMLDAQSEVRGYLLRVDRAFPATFDQRRKRTDALFSKLELLVRNDPAQEARVEGLIDSKNLWFNRAQVLLKGRVPGADDNADWVKTGDDLIDDLRAKFRVFIMEIEEGHEARLERVNAVKRAAGFGGGALAVILAVAVGSLVRRQFMELAVDYRTALHTIEQRHDALVRSEADLEAQKEWFRVTLTSIRDGVIVTDAEKRIVFMNHESERLTGWKNVEALLKPLPVVFHILDPVSRAALPDPVERARREKTPPKSSGPAVLIGRSGEEGPIEESASPILDVKGKLIGFVLVFRDVAEKSRAHEALQLHSHELEKRVAERTIALQQTVSELETFSYTVSHDLRSPLRAMQGFAQAVMEDYGEKLDDQARDYLQRIKNAAERLDRLIQDLLSYTRVARYAVAPYVVDLDKFVRELIQGYPDLHPPAAEVVIEGTLPRVLGHEPALTQIFANLLGNATKFIKPGVPSKIRISSEDKGELVRFWIEDNGIGIEPRDFERIFQMFVQVNDPKTYSGTGSAFPLSRKRRNPSAEKWVLNPEPTKAVGFGSIYPKRPELGIIFEFFDFLCACLSPLPLSRNEFGSVWRSACPRSCGRG